jgi:hypothetical protein
MEHEWPAWVKASDIRVDTFGTLAGDAARNVAQAIALHEPTGTRVTVQGACRPYVMREAALSALATCLREMPAP